MANLKKIFKRKELVNDEREPLVKKGINFITKHLLTLLLITWLFLSASTYRVSPFESPLVMPALFLAPIMFFNFFYKDVVCDENYKKMSKSIQRTLLTLFYSTTTTILVTAAMIVVIPTNALFIVWITNIGLLIVIYVVSTTIEYWWSKLKSK